MQAYDNEMEAIEVKLSTDKAERKKQFDTILIRLKDFTKPLVSVLDLSQSELTDFELGRLEATISLSQFSPNSPLSQLSALKLNLTEKQQCSHRKLLENALNALLKSADGSKVLILSEKKVANGSLKKARVSTDENFDEVKTYSNSEVQHQLNAPRTYEDGKDFYSKNGMGEKTFDSIELKESLVLSRDYNNMGTGKNNLAHLAVMNDDKKFYNRLVQIVGSENHKFFHTKNGEGKTSYQMRMQKEPYSVRLWALATCCAKFAFVGGGIPWLILGIAALICKATETIKEKLDSSKKAYTHISKGKHSTKAEGAFLGKFTDLHPNFAHSIPQP